MATVNMKFQCDPQQTVELVFREKAKLFVNQKALTIPDTQQQYLRFDTCLFSVKGNSAILRNRSSAQPTEITLNNANVSLRVHCNGQLRDQALQNVQKLLVYAGEIRVTRTQDGPAPTPAGNTTPAGGRTPPVGGTTPTPSGNEARLTQMLQEMTKKLNDSQAAHAAMQQERDRYRKIAEDGVDQLIQRYQSGQATPSDELNRKLSELTRLQNEQTNLASRNATLQSQIQQQIEQNRNAEAELQRLETELGNLRGQEEVTNLDCDKVRQELATVNTRLQMDGDIITLTESRWLKNNSVTETMEELRKKMDAVEERIGFILRAREAYSTAVQSAILRDGDGTISMSDESRMVSNGDTDTEN